MKLQATKDIEFTHLRVICRMFIAMSFPKKNKKELKNKYFY